MKQGVSRKTEEFSDQLFAKSRLIPAVVQEAGTNQVLMLAYMNQESLNRTFETGYTWFWSRSRQELWNKGGQSGHLQRVIRITADCDWDTLLVEVEQTGPACHTGNHSCFFRPLWEEEIRSALRERGNISEGGKAEETVGKIEMVQSAAIAKSVETTRSATIAGSVETGKPANALMDSMEALYQVALERRKFPQEGSYTCYLFEQGLDKILKKCGEECSEIIIAAKNGENQQTADEICDLLYHLTILMVEQDISLDQIQEILRRRAQKIGNRKQQRQSDHQS